MIKEYSNVYQLSRGISGIVSIYGGNRALNGAFMIRITVVLPVLTKNFNSWAFRSIFNQVNGYFPLIRRVKGHHSQCVKRLS